MNLGRTAARRIAGFSLIFVMAGASGLKAQDPAAEPEVRRGFYLSAGTALFSGLTFPSTFFTYKSIGGANVPDALYMGETVSLSSRPGLALALGYEWRFKGLRMGGEIEYALAGGADGSEALEDDVYYGATYTLVRTQRSFTQSGRKLSTIDLSLFMGLFPFRSFALGFNITAGVGYGRQSFTSPAVADAVGRKFDVNNLNGSTDFDFGTYDGNGSWHRGSAVYFIGAGFEVELSRRLSVRLDYKYVASSYTRENVLISSGAVNVYQESKGYEYTVGNKFSFGLNFRI
jgi:hypothetical protein